MPYCAAFLKDRSATDKRGIGTFCYGSGSELKEVGLKATALEKLFVHDTRMSVAHPETLRMSCKEKEGAPKVRWAEWLPVAAAWIS